jgi:hypothetical protein
MHSVIHFIFESFRSILCSDLNYQPTKVSKGINHAKATPVSGGSETASSAEDFVL